MGTILSLNIITPLIKVNDKTMIELHADLPEASLNLVKLLYLLGVYKTTGTYPAFPPVQT